MAITLELIEKILRINGFEHFENCTNIRVGAIMASRTTDKGYLEAFVGTNGSMRMVKPNCSVKWFYDKSPAQINSILRQTIESNTFKS